MGKARKRVFPDRKLRDSVIDYTSQDPSHWVFLTVGDFFRYVTPQGVEIYKVVPDPPTTDDKALHDMLKDSYLKEYAEKILAGRSFLSRTLTARRAVLMPSGKGGLKVCTTGLDCVFTKSPDLQPVTIKNSYQTVSPGRKPEPKSEYDKKEDAA